MTISTKATLKTYFETGDFPTESNFTDLIDTFLGLNETASQTVKGPVVVSGGATFITGITVSGTASLRNAVNVSGATGLYGDITFGASAASTARTSMGLGTAAVLNTGVSANNVPKLDSSNRLPAVDGSLLTNLPTGMTLLSTQTISSSTASLSVTSGINSSYSHYIWEISNLLSVSNTVDPYITVQQGGVYVGGTNYNSYGFKAAAGAVTATRDNGVAQFNITQGDGGILSASYPSVIRFEFWNPSLSLPLEIMYECMQAATGGNGAYRRSGGMVTPAAATTGIKLVMSSGNIATCTANLYGVT